uniref:Uncharacterized protein n=1 Tax=Candidatus Nitrotoga fabula TaxID=2182327 RepID=A0A2X0QSW8_9PROT|nr:protein of unknown function [Candidatus Nitrotoga fabula]
MEGLPHERLQLKCNFSITKPRHNTHTLTPPKLFAGTAIKIISHPEFKSRMKEKGFAAD